MGADAGADAREWMQERMQESRFVSCDLSEPIRCAKFRARERMRESGCERVDARERMRESGCERADARADARDHVTCLLTNESSRASAPENVEISNF